MNRKRIRYFIDLPGDWWFVKGKALRWEDAKGQRCSSSRTARTFNQALRILKNCPPGTTCSRMVSIWGKTSKRSKRYELAMWEKIE